MPGFVGIVDKITHGKEFEEDEDEEEETTSIDHISIVLFSRDTAK